LGAEATAWATNLLAAGDEGPLLAAEDLPLDTVAQVGCTVVETVGEKRSTWRRWNLHAEASRQIAGLRFTSTVDREAVVGLIVDAAERAALRLTPPELATASVVFQRSDGSSVFRPKHGVVFSSIVLLEAEDWLGSCDDCPARNDRHSGCYCALPDRASTYELDMTKRDPSGRTDRSGSRQPDRHARHRRPPWSRAATEGRTWLAPGGLDTLSPTPNIAGDPGLLEVSPTGHPKNNVIHLCSGAPGQRPPPWDRRPGHP